MTVRVLILLGAVAYFSSIIGIYTYPGSVNEWLQISKIGLFGDGHVSVLSRNQTTPLIARLLSVDLPMEWRIMTVVLASFAVALLFYVLHRASTRNLDFLLLVLVTLFMPLVRSVFNGVADYDGMTLLLLSLSFVFEKPLVLVSLGVLLGATSPEQSSLTLVVLMLVGVFAKDRSIDKFLIVFIACVSSGLLIRLSLADENIDWAGVSLHHSVSELFHYLPHFFGGAWIIVVGVLHVIASQLGFSRALAVGVTILVGVSTAFLITSDGARNFAPVLAFSSIYLIIRFGPLLSAKMIVVLATLSIVAQFAYLASGLNSFEPQYPTILDRVIALLQA